MKETIVTGALKASSNDVGSEAGERSRGVYMSPNITKSKLW